MSKLSRDELEDFWALDVPLEASCVPDDELVRALAQSRIKRAVSSSSMGTAETAWYPADAKDGADLVSLGVVLPPGQNAVWPDDTIDDRDRVRALWEPFWKEQEYIVGARIDAGHLEEFVRAIAGVRPGIDQAKVLAAKNARAAMRVVFRTVKKNQRRTEELRALRFELLRIGVRIVRQRARNATNAP
jgi:hypothetical protein